MSLVESRKYLRQNLETSESGATLARLLEAEETIVSLAALANKQKLLLKHISTQVHSIAERAHAHGIKIIPFVNKVEKLSVRRLLAATLRLQSTASKSQRRIIKGDLSARAQRGDGEGEMAVLTDLSVKKHGGRGKKKKREKKKGKR